MKYNHLIYIILAFFLTYCSSPVNGPDPASDKEVPQSETSSQNTNIEIQSTHDVWVGAYMASWNHFAPPTGNWGNLPTDEIDWDAFTHMYYFAFNAQSDGSLSEVEPFANLNPDRLNQIVAAAHDNSKPILFSVGGYGNYDGFSSAISPSNRSTFISNLISIMQEWDFDGIDLDMEPINDRDVDNYKAFVQELRAALDQTETTLLNRPLLVTATIWQPEMHAELNQHFDQINLMTYDFSGAWPGWVSWHNSPVFNGGLTFESNGRELPSIDESVDEFINAGVPKEKLGIGIDFYGYVWQGGSGTSTGGVTEPNQSWDSAPQVTDNVPYYEIMSDYFQQEFYHWDDQAEAAYLSIDKNSNSEDHFISYDDEQTIRAKFEYIRQKGVGGAIIWELTGGYREDQPDGERDNLLQQVKASLNNADITPPPDDGDTTPPTATIESPQAGATVSDIVLVDVSASDNNEIDQVELSIGSSVNTVIQSPFTFEWNTENSTDGPVDIEVVATDAAGNTTQVGKTVEVDNSTDNNGDDSNNTTGALAIYNETLEDPWINTSWSSNIDFNSSERTFNGQNAIKVQQSPWGSLSLRSGDWGAPEAFNASDFSTLRFAIYPSSQSVSLNISLRNSNGDDFPTVQKNVTANNWSVIEIPTEELNPNGLSATQIDIVQTNGSSRTYHIDDYYFGESDGSSGSDDDITVETPALIAPAANASGLDIPVTLEWSGSADSYTLEVATDNSFSSVIERIDNTASLSHTVQNLQQGTTYFWRVKGFIGSSQSTWSEIREFATKREESSGTTGDALVVFDDQLADPWINTSYNASIDFGNGERASSGTSAIKVDQNAWGALSTHFGNWGSGEAINPANYQSVEFDVYVSGSGGSFNILLQVDDGTSIPTFEYGSVESGRWVTISIPMDQLNPDGINFQRISIMETSGVSKTYHVDEFNLIEKSNS